jgi:hypothetical protein
LAAAFTAVGESAWRRTRRAAPGIRRATDPAWVVGQQRGAEFAGSVTPVIAVSLDMCRMSVEFVVRIWVRNMSVPLKAASYHTTEHLLELALTMLESARREQNNDQLPANNWLTNNFTLEIIRAKVAANKANVILNV